MKTIRWGIIGCGDVTETKSGPGFAKAQHSALVAVMRRDGAKAADYAKRHNVPHWFDDARNLIECAEVDAIYIATPPDAHESYTALCAAAGKPVYVEKPMARSYDECVRMVGVCRDAGVKLFVAYYRRALPRFLKIQELIQGGAVGNVRLVNVRLHVPADPADLDPANLPWRVLPHIAGAGRFLDLASHTLDLLDFLISPITHASGHAHNQAGQYPAEDIVTGSFQFASGALGAGAWCFNAHARTDEVEIVGDKGKITFATFDNHPIRLESQSGDAKFDVAHPPHIQQPMIQSVVNDLLGQEHCASTGVTGSRTSRVMDQMLAGFRSRDV